MANLRTNNLSGEGGRNAIRGSLFFNSSYPTSSVNGLDSLTVPAGSDFAYGTGDFTFEAYVWMSSFSSTVRLIYSQTVSGTNYILFGITTSGQVTVILGHSNSETSTATIALNSWNHVAVSRSSGTVKVFVNGVASSGSSITTDLNDTTRIPTIGKYTHSTQLAWKGYISNFRICKGHAVYTTDFTPPTSELKAHYLSENDKTVLLCCQDSDNPLQEATGKTITGYGRYADSSVELVTNHSFNNGTTGWTLSDANEGSMTVTDGSLVLTNDDTSDPPVYAWQAVTTVVGQTYNLKVHFSGGTVSPNLAVYLNSSSSFGGDAGGSITADSVSGNGIKTLQFTSQHATTYVLVRVNANSAGTAIFSAVSIKAADYGDAPKVIPPVGVDAGNTFDGAISMNSPSWMYFPTGKTEERARGRALWGGGDTTPTPYATVIDFIQIQSAGIGQDFGNLSVGGNQTRGISSTTRGIFGGGRRTPANTSTNIMDFVTIATQSNATDFGDLSNPKAAYAEISSATRGIFANGYDPAATNTIDYVTIATLGNAQDFGDGGDPRYTTAGTQSTTRGIIAGGANPSLVGTYNAIEFITIATTGNSQDFGDLTNSRHSANATSNGVRGVFMGGGTPSGHNVIDYITIASEGDAIDFGDLGSMTNGQGCATSDKIRGVFGLGYLAPAYLNVIQQVTIATTGNSVDVGELSTLRHQAGCLGDAHGGL